MIIPVRCFTCNKVIGHLWKPYQELILEYSNDPQLTEAQQRCKAMNELGLIRYCCRTVFLGHVELSDTLLQYANNPGEKVTRKIEKV